MRKLLFITFICSSLCAYAQSEIPEDTIKNRPPVKKEQIPFSPKENKRTGLDESQPQQSLQGEQQEEINLHLPPSDYVEPLPWTDMMGDYAALYGLEYCLRKKIKDEVFC